MRHIKVSLYPAGATYVLRYGSTWETLTVNNYSDATAKRIERELEFEN